MRDWPELVEERLNGLALEPAEKAEIIAELAEHLEDICDAMSRHGVSEVEAVQRALSQVGSWRSLQSKILAAKRREYFMRNRVRQLWFPGLLTLFLAAFFLISLQMSGFRPYVLHSGASTVLLYWPWLVALLVFGALGAYVSLRAGGSRTTAVLTTVFPAAALAGAFLLMFPIGVTAELVTHRHSDWPMVAAFLLGDGISWLLIPGVALLAGGLLAQALMTGRGASRQQVAS